ncbi:MAG TPA: tetraacyldisaccharide 4'-kinase [Stellaceae bacterium]
MRAPEFWTRSGLVPALLAPLGALYGAAGAARRRAAKPWHAPIPVVCVGNLVAGGAGKTPVVLSLARLLAAEGKAVHVVTRGYGGRFAGPVAVDPARHDAEEVGDEPLLLAAAAPTWVARDRVAGAREAVAAGAGILLLDDGFQNPALAKDLSLLVVDGGYGFGNGLVMPAGPLREPVGAGLARAQAVVLIGEDEAGAARAIDDGQGRPPTLLRADLVPARDAAADLAGRRVLAFAGIGRPAKFFATLERLGAEIAESRAFPDHHPYAAAEIEGLLAAARSLGAMPVTTAKDAVRLPPALRDAVRVLPVDLVWREPDAVASLIDRFVLSPRSHG